MLHFDARCAQERNTKLRVAVTFTPKALLHAINCQQAQEGANAAKGQNDGQHACEACSKSLIAADARVRPQEDECANPYRMYRRIFTLRNIPVCVPSPLPATARADSTGELDGQGLHRPGGNSAINGGTRQDHVGLSGDSGPQVAPAKEGSTFHDDGRVTLALCCIMRDEGIYLQEWIEHSMLVGKRLIRIILDPSPKMANICSSK